jgi:hypothetical protein
MLLMLRQTQHEEIFNLLTLNLSKGEAALIPTN